MVATVYVSSDDDAGGAMTGWKHGERCTGILEVVKAGTLMTSFMGPIPYGC